MIVLVSKNFRSCTQSFCKRIKIVLSINLDSVGPDLSNLRGNVQIGLVPNSFTEDLIRYLYRCEQMSLLLTVFALDLIDCKRNSLYIFHMKIRNRIRVEMYLCYLLAINDLLTVIPGSTQNRVTVQEWTR